MAAAASALHAWSSAQHGNQTTHPPHLSGVTVHQPAVQPSHPPRPSCYVDATFSPTSGKAAFGAVLIAPDGSFTAACAGPSIDCFSPLMAEAVACKEALSWLRSLGVDATNVLMDCSQLYSGLKRSQPSVYSYAGLFLDACRSAAASFSSCHFILVPRSSNTLAHTLASAAGSQASVLYWDSVPPDSIASFF